MSAKFIATLTISNSAGDTVATMVKRFGNHSSMPLAKARIAECVKELSWVGLKVKVDGPRRLDPHKTGKA